MLLEYWELGRLELNTPGDMGGEKNDRVAGDPHRRLRVKHKTLKSATIEHTKSKYQNFIIIYSSNITI